MKRTESSVVLPGQAYGRLTVLETFSERGHQYARVQCSCGSPPRYARTDGLRNGKSQSCGCLHKERVTKHGAWGTPLFKVWAQMVRRCTNPKDQKFARYGGRGIAVCDRWLNVNNFIADMTQGYEPGLQIDRIDNDGPYAPSNCRWSTTKQQTRNYSRNVILEHDGRRMCVVDWALETGIRASLIYDRIARGWSAARALKKP